MNRCFVLLLCVFSLNLTESTINVCVPLNSATNDLADISLEEIVEKISAALWEFLSELFNEKGPMEMDHIDVNLSHPAIHLKGSMDKVVITNLSQISACFFDVKISNFSTKFNVFNLTFNEISANGFYDLKGDLGDLFALFGKGPFWAKMQNFSIAMTRFNLSLGDDNEACFPINLDIDLGKQLNHFDHLMNDAELEDLFNRAFESILPETMRIIWDEWKGMFDKPLEKLINDLLHKHPELGSYLLRLNNLDKGDMDIILGPYCFSKENPKSTLI